MIDTQTQIERRRERAATDIARIVNRGRHPVYSTFEVTSTSERTYPVQIRSLTELLNTCTCPDYRTNLIGTCKHIEGVLLNLQERVRRRSGTSSSPRPRPSPRSTCTTPSAPPSASPALPNRAPGCTSC